MLLDTLSIFVKNMLKKVLYIFSIGGLLANIYATSLTEQVSCIHNKMLRLHDSLDSKTLKEELGDLIKEWQVVKLELDMRGYTCDYE